MFPNFDAAPSFTLATPIHAVPVAVVDVETTGLSPREGDRVVEVAVLRVDTDGRREVFASLINPGRPISPGASAVNGIRNSDLIGQPRFAEIAAEVGRLVRGAALVMHNAPFDMGFLVHEHTLAGASMPDAPVIDTLVLARRWFSFRSNNLGAVARSLGVRVQRAHRAGGDVETTHEVFRRMVDHLAPHGFATVGDFTRAAPSPGRRADPPRPAAPPP